MSPLSPVEGPAGPEVAGVDLNRPLPAEVLRDPSGGLAAYRTYPVFSWPWLRKRTLLFGVCIGLLGALSGLGAYGAQERPWTGLGVAVQFIVCFLTMTTLGPLLATLVRHRGMPARRERGWVVGALLVGICASYRVDGWASRTVGELTQVDFEGHVLNGQLKIDAMSPAALAMNVTILVILYGLLGGGLAVRSYLAEPARLLELLRERELAQLRAQKQAVDLRLGVLQAQVEPHFLFNTLASVRSLVGTDAGKAQTTIDALVDYLRATIPRLRDDAARVDSTLGQQIELCESYLKLMQVRMGGRLRYTIDLPAHLRGVSFPPLLLINLVENAVKHGVEPKPGPAHIALRAREDDDGLQVSVIDDGVGLREQLGAGMGLSNVREQLRARYDDQAQLSLTQAPGTGTVASITLLREEDKA